MTRSPGRTRALVVQMLLIIWEITARFVASPDYVAAPSQIVIGLGSLLAIPGVTDALLQTLVEIVVAFVLAVVVGVILGTVLGLNGLIHRVLMPPIMLLYATPKVAIMPLFILGFGIGTESKIAFGISHGLFPVIVSVTAAVQNTKPVFAQAATMMGASSAQRIYYVLLPQIAPSLFTATRLCMTAVLLGVLLAELYVSEAGIGALVRQFAAGFEPVPLFGLIAIVAGVAIVLNEGLRVAESRMARWRQT